LNIFAIEKTPTGKIDWIKSAQSQDNYRVVKMTLESCQLLCTSLNILSGEKVSPYRTTHTNHPTSVWVRESSENFERLLEHTDALLSEYSNRFNKIHKCSMVLDTIISLYSPAIFPSQKETNLTLCMPDFFKEDCIVESYRRFYASKPNIRYPKEKIPSWFAKYRGDIPFVVI